MKDRLKFLGYLLSIFILFYSGAWCIWLEFYFDNSFIKLSWIPIFAIGILLNIYFLRIRNDKRPSSSID